jgi:hypothetical protein
LALARVLVQATFAFVGGREAWCAEIGAEEVWLTVFASRVVSFEDEFVGAQRCSEEETVLEDAEDQGGETSGCGCEAEEGADWELSEDLDKDLYMM